MDRIIGFVGPPQIVALVLLAQRGLEEVYSARHTNRLLAQGAREAGADYYPVVAVAHLAWIAAIFLLVPASGPIVWPFAALFVALQAVRYWVIGSLGPFWTHRIITLDAAPIMRRGPYRWLRHPNYAVTIAETLILPFTFEAWAVGAIFTAVWIAVIRYKIRLEDAALAARRQGSSVDVSVSDGAARTAAGVARAVTTPGSQRPG